MKNFYDVIVVGAGHAGVEAAHVAATMNINTLLITLDKNKIAVMPCNPSIGGLGKGHIVYEISALGGLMPKLCTKSYLQARMLNTRKGPAVQGLRLQIDKYSYSKNAQKALSKMEKITVAQNVVSELLWESTNKKIRGVRCEDGQEFFCKSLVITSGTYLNGEVHIGLERYSGGKDDSAAVSGLTESIEQALETKLKRLKTGTPPRLLRSSIDFSKLEAQKEHTLKYLFEFQDEDLALKEPKDRIQCYIAYTNKKTHKIIKDNLEKSALFGGAITGTGPRYCPSIEDKISRFPDRESHHVFIEPEGGENTEIYPSGLSTSLPLEVQKKYINSISGLENAVITRPGYAIEYDFLQPNNLKHSLETKKISGLFFAGQINGTTGYEEAAGQGLIAGINAALRAQDEDLPPFILKRTESYIGVMIDDLVSIGVDEPYRMFTSRAERRLLLRQDNVFSRLMPYAKKLGIVSDETYEKFLKEKTIIDDCVKQIKAQRPHGKIFRLFHDIDFFKKKDSMKEAIESSLDGKKISDRALLSIHAEIRYDGYIEKELKEIKKSERFQDLKIPTTIEYREMPGLTKELQEKLIRHKPETIAQAALIRGMTISLLIFQSRKTKNKKTPSSTEKTPLV